MIENNHLLELITVIAELADETSDDSDNNILDCSSVSNSDAEENPEDLILLTQDTLQTYGPHLSQNVSNFGTELFI